MRKKILSASMLLFLFFAAIAGFAQKWTLEVTGTILSGTKSLTGAKASIYADSNLVMAVTSVNGTFDFFLEPDNDYTLTFSKSGYVPTYILFSTKNVPAKRAKDGFSAYNIVVLLAPKKKGTEVEQAVNAPQAVVKYDSSFEDGDFTYDKAYAKSFKPFLKVVDREIKEAVDEEKADTLKSERKEESQVIFYAAGAMLVLIIAFAVYIMRLRKEKQGLLDELQKKQDDIKPS
jgi:hypothetical protein